jgi:3-oxoacyl-[acyl-carrier protein] reductase
MRLNNKVALVTGAASGFGKGIAATFAREGARVAVIDIDGEAARAAAASVSNTAIAVRCDVSQRADVDAAVNATVDAFGAIDILVNNAGMSHVRRPMLEVEEAEFDRLMAVNVKSIFLFAHAVVPLMRKQKSGVIINIGSTAGIRPRPGLTWYNASKGAVNLVSKSMAAELAPDGIRVCAIAPVMAETPLLPTFMGGDSPELRAQFKATVPPTRPPSSPATCSRSMAGAASRQVGRECFRFGLASSRANNPSSRSPSPLPCRARLLGCASCGDVNAKTPMPRGRASSRRSGCGTRCARRAWIKPSAAPSSSTSTTPRSPGSSF